MTNDHITASTAHGYSAAQGSDADGREMAICTECGHSMLLASISRHFRTACENNPSRVWYKCPECPRKFFRKDALRRHLVAPQACPGSSRTATLPGSDMGPGPSRMTRTRTTRRSVPYAPSPASSSGSGSSRRRRGGYSSNSTESSMSPATFASPPALPTTDLDPVKECYDWTPLSPMRNPGALEGNPQFLGNLHYPQVQSSYGMEQYSRYFEQLHAPSSVLTDRFSQYGQVPPPIFHLPTSSRMYSSNETPLEITSSTLFSGSWDTSPTALLSPVLQSHEHSGVPDTLAGFTTSDTEHPQAIAYPACGYPLTTGDQPTFGFQEPAHPQIACVESGAQSSFGCLDYPLVPGDYQELAPTSVEHQTLWGFGLDATTLDENNGGDLRWPGTNPSDFIFY